MGKCAEAVNSSFESIEFSVKALCKVLDVEFKQQHFLDQLTVAKLAEKIGKTWSEKKPKLLSVLPIILSYSDSLREIARRARACLRRNYSAGIKGTLTANPNDLLLINKLSDWGNYDFNVLRQEI